MNSFIFVFYSLLAMLGYMILGWSLYHIGFYQFTAFIGITFIFVGYIVVGEAAR